MAHFIFLECSISKYNLCFLYLFNQLWWHSLLVLANLARSSPRTSPASCCLNAPSLFLILQIWGWLSIILRFWLGGLISAAYLVRQLRNVLAGVMGEECAIF